MSTRAAAPATSEVPVWRPLAKLPFAQAAFVVARAQCAPSTLHVTCAPGETSFAVSGEDAVYGWHWAVFSATGIKLDGGWEETRSDAQRVALEARHLWSHRCGRRRGCGCGHRAR